MISLTRKLRVHEEKPAHEQQEDSITTHTATMNKNFAHRGARQLSRLVLLAAVAFTLLLCEYTLAAAATRWVNDDAASYLPPGASCNDAGYSAIQAAVDAASPGDVIQVCPGAYPENVVIGTSHLTVTSTAGAPATVVKPAASAYVFAVAAPGTTIRGFTMVPAGFADFDFGVNVAIDGIARVRILDNEILGGRIGVNLGCASVGSVVAFNRVNGQTEGGINIDTCEVFPFPGSHNNSIHHNVACSQTFTGSIALGGSSDNNQVHHNITTKISLFGTGNAVHDNITQLVIVDNGVNTLNDNTADPGVCSAACP